MEIADQFRGNVFLESFHPLDLSGIEAWRETFTASVAPGKPAIRFRTTVLVVRPERELRWRGKLLVAGIFDGEHYFLLETFDEKRTRLVHGENFSGLLVGPLSGMLVAAQVGFDAMNAALKQLAESEDSLFASEPG
jgi:hypothetical protein